MKKPEQIHISDEERQERLKGIIERVFLELKAAEEKHPGWPDDPIHGAAIVGEESGELLQAAIDCVYAGWIIAMPEKEVIKEQMKIEAAQTAAVAIRFLLWAEGLDNE